MKKFLFFLTFPLILLLSCSEDDPQFLSDDPYCKFDVYIDGEYVETPILPIFEEKEVLTLHDDKPTFDTLTTFRSKNPSVEDDSSIKYEIVFLPFRETNGLIRAFDINYDPEKEFKQALLSYKEFINISDGYIDIKRIEYLGENSNYRLKAEFSFVTSHKGKFLHIRNGEAYN
jgi:hypothetical protein